MAITTKQLDFLYKNVVLPPVRFVTEKDPEIAHRIFHTAMRFHTDHPGLSKKILGDQQGFDERLRQVLMKDVVFDSPFGTAAGLDKDADIYPGLQRLTGVGFIETGAICEKRQPGNPTPRIVRADKKHLINAMGFPSVGMDVVASNFRRIGAPSFPVGAQLGLNKETHHDDAARSYASVAERLLKVRTIGASRMLPDFFTLNVSSRNTPKLRELQEPGRLEEIISAVVAVLDGARGSGVSRNKLLLKLSPDIEMDHLETLLGVILRWDLAGVILSNTTLARPIRSQYNARQGGFSGPALYDKVLRQVKFAAKHLPSNRLIVAVGGINSADRAYEMLQYAQLIQGYTAIVLEGPRIYAEIASAVAARMASDGVGSLEELRAVPNRPQVALAR